MTLRDRVVAWRKHFGLSQGRIARKIGISTAAVSLWEQEDGTEPTHDNLAAFCDVLGISLAQFWGPVPDRPARSRKAA